MPVDVWINRPSHDQPVQNADGTTEIYYGPKSPGAGKNWLATIPGKGFFTILRRMAYLWEWPLVNSHNRRTAFAT